LEKPSLSPIFIFLLGILVLVLSEVNEAQAAPPAWQASSAIAASTGADVTVTLPVHAANDILLLQVVVRDVDDTITWPAGWTQIATVDRGTTARYWWAWKRAASAAEPNPLVNKNTATGDTYAAVTTYRGAITTGDPWEVKGTPNTSTAAGHVLNGITTLTAESLIVASLCGEDNTAASGTTFSATNPASLAQVLYVESATGSDGACTAGAAARATAGATGNVTATWTATVVGSGGIVLALKPAPPSVSSINRASADPTSSGTAVSWTVVFSASMTGVDTTDFALVQAGGVTGASITSVTGSGTTWTVTANTGSGTGTLGLNLVDNDTIIDAGSIPLGGAGAGNGNFTGQVYTVSPPFCSPPSNIPVGVTVSCVCDQFGRASLNPSTIYGANWIVSTSDTTGIVPYINGTSGLLRLTENTGNNAKAATVPGIFPAAGNYISVEFQHYAYGGSGADGIAVTLSDYAVTAVPGAFGGSLGYAQKTPPAVATNVPGFAGGWIGVGIDEFGNYQNPTEGRIGGPGARVDSVGVRGSGSGVTGYNWMAGTTTLAPGIDNTGSATPAPGYYYQVIVDARNDPTSTSVTVNRDTGAGYTSLINVPDVYTAATAQGFTQSPVPTNWQISFTGSTGGSTNIHEIGGLRICAQTVAPPSGGTASGFNAIDEAYGTPPSGPAVQSFLNGHIYMKLVGVAFKLNVAALNNNQILTTYAAGGNKNVTVKLVDNSDGLCVLDSTQANYCNAACTSKTAVTGGSQTMTFVAGDSGKKQSANFTLNSAYKNLAAIMGDGTTTACSTDAFSVRPVSIASVTSSNATNTATTGIPIFKAGSDNFSLTATTSGIAGNPNGYTGVLKINNSAVQAASPATVIGTLAPTTFPGATSGTPSSTATGNTFTYSEVGGFYFRGYNPATDATSARGVYDGVATATECASLTAAQCDILRAATWMGIDSITSKGDCVQNNYSNTKDANGKYGCSFGIVANTGAFGRFTPAFFNVTKIHACLAATPPFTYSGQPFSQVKVSAMAAGSPPTPTLNYNGTTGLAKLVTLSDGNGFAGGAYGNGSFPAANFTSNGDQTKTDVSFVFSTKETPPVTIKLRATDADLVSSNNAAATEDTAEIRSGRVRIQNAYGSELAALLVPMRAEYYVDTTITAPATNPSVIGWITNSADTCTSIPATGLSLANNVAPSPVTPPTLKNVGSKNTLATVTYSPLVGGDAGLSLSAPSQGGDGYVDITADLSAKTWLRFDWNGTGDVDPTGRATFGLYRGSPSHIYLRQRYN